jgi:hypothetical protein
MAILNAYICWLLGPILVICVQFNDGHNCPGSLWSLATCWPICVAAVHRVGLYPAGNELTSQFTDSSGINFHAAYDLDLYATGSAPNYVHGVKKVFDTCANSAEFRACRPNLCINHMHMNHNIAQHENTNWLHVHLSTQNSKAPKFVTSCNQGRISAQAN